MTSSRRRPSESPTPRERELDLPVSALLSQALVAFTIELDNEFEHRMSEAGLPGAHLSLVIWSNLLRFLADGPAAARDLAASALSPIERVKFQLGCLERWGFVELQTNAADGPIARRPTRRKHAVGRREGWGSGRGIRGDSIASLTAKGLKSAEIWEPLPVAIEGRWRSRFGKQEIDRLRRSLQAVVDKRAVELPQGFVGGRTAEWSDSLPPRTAGDAADPPLSTLLSQALQIFTIEFDREADATLELSAGVLRVLGKQPVRAGDLPHLTGGSPEKSDIGWELKRYVTVGADRSANRGKVVRLTPLGLRAQQTYLQLVVEIERRWEAKVGKAEICEIHRSLEELLNRREGDGWLVAEGLKPAPDVLRAGNQTAALGRRSVGVAARKRMRDLVVQTEDFLRDPPANLPHYPLWDMNRGFGP
jgi:hypothetical protein